MDKLTGEILSGKGYVLFSFGCCLALMLVVWWCRPALAAERRMSVNKETQAKVGAENSPFHAELLETGGGVRLHIRYKGTEKERGVGGLPGQTGGIYTIFMDGMMVAHDTFSDKDLDVTKPLPSMHLLSGKHLVQCVVRSATGNEYTQEVSFVYSGQPTLALTDVAIDRAGLLDASVELHVPLDETDNNTGFVQIFFDNRQVAEALLSPNAIGQAMTLSELAGTPLSTAGLATGNHLLGIQIAGPNGERSTSYSPFSITATVPELRISRDKDTTFQEAVVTFPADLSGHAGAVDVLLDNSILLSRQAAEQQLTISRAEILTALAAADSQTQFGAISLIFALRAPNGTENWQHIEFKQ